MGLPIYLQIKNEMIEIIEKMPAHEAIPSERDLAKQHNASRMTVRKAVNFLVDEGYLYRDANRGTFVAPAVLHKKNTTLEEKIDERDIYYKLIFFDVKSTSTKEVQDQLHIGPDDNVVRMIRLAVIEGKPQYIEEIYIKRLNLSDEEFGNLPKRHDLKTLAASQSLTQRFVPSLVPHQYAHLLNMKINDPIIIVENIINAKSGRPLIFMKVFNNPKERIIEITS